MSDVEQSAVVVKDLYKSFKLPHEKHSGLKQAAVGLFKGKRGFEKQVVLKDISFEIKKGEFFGIVGRNGSGKSTLLKLLAGIYAPDEGLVQVNGSLTPFIELGVGFNPELTGRENVFLNGALLGFSRDEMEKMYDDIVNFAELEKFMDQKLKNYSSGMQVRLAFSIAIRARSDILLIDEVLAVGDAEFQQKCFQYFDKLKEEKRTIILVSHDMSAVKQFCDKAVLIHKGKIVKSGDVGEIALEYERLNFSTAPSQNKKVESKIENPVTIDFYKDGVKTQAVESGQEIEAIVTWSKDYDVRNVGIILMKNQELIFATNSFHTPNVIKGNTAKAKLHITIGDGRYKLRAGLFGIKGKRDVLGIFGNEPLVVYGARRTNKNGDDVEGIVELKTEWQ